LTNSDTRMRAEILEIPDVVRRLMDVSMPAIDRAADDLRNLDPFLITTVARGSSDHAAAYLKYALELSAGVPVASIGPSVASIYGASLRLSGAASIAISQSGQSPDIVRMAETARAGGALTIALTNDAGSPLAKASEHAIDIAAGAERSVAATKTFVASIVAGLALIGRWRGDDALLAALEAFPEQCRRAIDCDWSPLADKIGDRDTAYVLGRGPSMAISEEVALKFKETCQIHAESYSSAEVLHGPVSIVGSGFPVIALAARDAAEGSVVETAERIAQKGADVFVTSAQASDRLTALPFVASGHPLTDPLLLIVAFYAFIENLARRRGLEPDNPPHLRKVTETI